MSSGRAIEPIFLTTCSFSSAASAGSGSVAFLEDHKRRDRLPLQLVRAPDDRRLGHLRMIDQRALHFHRADAVSRHVNHVVHTAEHPEVAVFVALRAVAGEVDRCDPTCSSTACTKRSGSP